MRALSPKTLRQPHDRLFETHAMKLSLRLLLFGLLALLSVQPGMPQNARKRTKANTVTFDPKPFNKYVEDLPPNYIGNSYFNILIALMNRNKVAAKGEFESTIDYKARIERVNSQALTGGLTFKSLLAFSFYLDGGQLTAKYDADLTVLDVTLKWDRNYGAGSYDNQFFSLTWRENSQFVGAYVGRNAFNVRRRIQVYRNDDYYLAASAENLSKLNRPEDKRPVSFDNAFNTSIFMPPSVARVAKGNIRALIVCRLAETPLYQDKDVDEPEITDPYARFNFKHIMAVIPEEIWFYDLPSGKVYAKVAYESATPVEQKTEENGIAEFSQNSRNPDPTRPTPKYESNKIYKPSEVSSKARILSRPAPLYTEEARQQQVSGVVVLRAVFRADGRVTDIRSVSGLPHGLTEKAVEAAQKIKFAPATVGGRPVSQYVQIEYVFNAF